jgi:hypothetical protein
VFYYTSLSNVIPRLSYVSVVVGQSPRHYRLGRQVQKSQGCSLDTRKILYKTRRDRGIT